LEKNPKHPKRQKEKPGHTTHYERLQGLIEVGEKKVSRIKGHQHAGQPGPRAFLASHLQKHRSTHEKQNAADDQKAIHHLPSPNGQGDQHDPQSTGNTDTNQNTFETASTRASSPFGFFSSRTLVIPIVLIFLNLRNFVNVHRTLSLTLDWGRCL